MKRKMVMACIAMILLLCISAFAGTWEGSAETGWRYRGDDGNYVTENWVQDGGAWYYLGADGVMLHDAWVQGLYYVGPDGKMLVDTVTPDGYRVGADGAWIRDAALVNASAAAAEPVAAAEAAGIEAEEVPSLDQLVPVLQAAVQESEQEDIHFVVEKGGEDKLIIHVLTYGDMEDIWGEFAVQLVAEAVGDTWSEFAAQFSGMMGRPIAVEARYYYNDRFIQTNTY